MSNTRMTRACALSIALGFLPGCGTTVAVGVPPVGSELVFEGRLSEIDTAPWAYDGNARLRVATERHGALTVELPARWNLCLAQPFGEMNRYAVGDRVRVAGTVTGPATVTVCAQPTHMLARSP